MVLPFYFLKFQLAFPGWLYPCPAGGRLSGGRFEALLETAKPQFGGFHEYLRKRPPGPGPICIDKLSHFAIILTKIRSLIPCLGGVH